MKYNIRHIIFLVVTIIAYILFEIYAPKPINWQPTFSKNDKIPFGQYVLYNLLNDSLLQKNIEENEISFFQFLKQPNTRNCNYLIFNQVFTPSKTELAEFLSFVDSGGNLFIAASKISGELLDTVGCKATMSFPEIFTADSGFFKLNFTAQKLKTDSAYIFSKGIDNLYFKDLNKQPDIEILATCNNQPDFIRKKIGKGYLYLHLHPFAFTNFAVLENNNYEYVFKCLSYLPYKKTFWDEYHKPGQAASGTPIIEILKRDSLRWAWFLMLLGVSLYVVFKTKREQRIIPIINPPKNTSLDFINTVARLYFNSKDNKDIVIKRFTYFNEYLFVRFGKRLNINNAENNNELSKKAGTDIELLTVYVSKYKQLIGQPVVSDVELIEYNKLLEKLYSLCR